MLSLSPAREATLGTHTARRGSALVLGLLMLMLVSSVVVGFLNMTRESSRRTVQDSDQALLQAAAESAITLAVDQVWGRFEAARANEERTTQWDFRAFMDGAGILAQASDDPHSAKSTDLLRNVRLAANRSARRAVGIGGVRVEELGAYRVDDLASSRMVFQSRVTLGEGQAARTLELEHVYSVEPASWQGLDFGLLANNITCTICHAQVDNAHRYFNRDPEKFGTFPRVKVGALEALHLRNEVYSSIAGTLYLAGKALTHTGLPIGDWGTRDFKSAEFDGLGWLAQGRRGDTSAADLDPAHALSPAPFENLYLQYGIGGAGQVDGYMPRSFPSVFPDDGGIDPVSKRPVPGDAGNRQVDPSEFFAATFDADGTIAGGSIQVLGSSESYGSAGEILSESTPHTRGSIAGALAGNVVLRGTRANPILLDGTLAIDGDLVISGFVQGEGTLKVSGNVYVPSDLRYLDAEGNGGRSFGVAAGGTENALALAAGGNIMVGNLYHGRWGRGVVNGEKDGSFSFIMDELALFNRAEWAKTQPTVLTTDDLVIANPSYAGPDYTPRYYSFTGDSTIPIFNKRIKYNPRSGAWVGKEHVAHWDDSRLTYVDPNDRTSPFLFDARGNPIAVVSQLTPEAGWIPDAVMLDFIQQSIGARDPDEALVIDALLYSSNSVFGIIPTSERAPGLDGRLEINGAVVAADLGLLAPTEIRVNYDQRGRRLLNLTSDRQLAIRRVLVAP